MVSSGRDRHTGNRTRCRSDTSIFRGSFSPPPLYPVPIRPRIVFKTLPETKSRLSHPFTPPPRHRALLHRRPRGTQSFQKPSRRTETHATSHCLIAAGVGSFVSGPPFSFHLRDTVTTLLPFDRAAPVSSICRTSDWTRRECRRKTRKENHGFGQRDSANGTIQVPHMQRVQCKSENITRICRGGVRFRARGF